MTFLGKVLVASPYLNDKDFQQGVVLIVNETPNEIMGVLLNRPSVKTIQDVWKEIFQKTCQRDSPLYIGGPVLSPLIALHTNRFLGEKTLIPNVYISMEKENIEFLVEHEPKELQLFLGHSGWSRRQLVDELDEGVWQMFPAQKIDLFSPDDAFWFETLQKSSSYNLQRLLNVKEFPDDPLVN